jgi:hypothetical protein
MEASKSPLADTINGAQQAGCQYNPEEQGDDMKTSCMLMFLVLLAVLAPVVPLTAQVGSKTPPTFLTVNPKSVRDDNATYSFEVTISASRDAEGMAQLTVITSITKIAGEQTVRFREITQTISPDASAFTITADGKQFLFEAQYVEPSGDKTAPPRFVTTTYGVMFGGGRVGISARRTN